MSTVLGLAQNQHDSCLSIIRNGDVLVHVQMERVLRQKRATFQTPNQALALLSWVSDEYDISQIDAIAVVRHMIEPTLRDTLSILRQRYPQTELLWFEHLDCHLALAAASGMDDCVAFALDGGGDRRIRAGAPNAAIERWRDGTPESSRVISSDEVVVDGRAWSILSHALFGDEHAAGKVMGLAAYGRESQRARDQIDALISACLDWRYDNGGRNQLVHLVSSDSFQHGADLAFALQQRFGAAMAALVSRTAPEASNIVLTGGCALNVVANTIVAQLRGVEGRTWVPPCPGDEGISLGAAIRASVALGDRIAELRSPYFGLSDAGPPSSSATRSAAESLARGQVIATAVGASEIGPRALGNRSFLAIPTAENRERVSERMKRREWFRPVAPAMRATDLAEWLCNPVDSPFMSFAGEVTSAMVECCPGAVHIDGTARHQSVDADRHPTLAMLLDDLADLGLPPVLINTSLNTNGRPICSDASDALATALEAGADGILLSSGFVALA